MKKTILILSAIALVAFSAVSCSKKDDTTAALDSANAAVQEATDNAAAAVDAATADAAAAVDAATADAAAAVDAATTAASN